MSIAASFSGVVAGPPNPRDSGFCKPQDQEPDGHREQREPG